MKKAENNASAYYPSPGTSTSRTHNQKCPNCAKLIHDIMELKKKLGWYKNPQEFNQLHKHDDKDINSLM